MESADSKGFAVENLSEIVEKIEAKHHVDLREVKETLSGSRIYKHIDKGRRLGEDVYAALGQTSAGRYLIVFFFYKADLTLL
jgi:uncharacterized DUF497 family protein